MEISEVTALGDEVNRIGAVGNKGIVLRLIRRGQKDGSFAPSLDAGTSIDESLARLQLDYVDLYLLHWPKAGMQPAAMMGALNDVVNAGKARFADAGRSPRAFSSPFKMTARSPSRAFRASR